MITNDQPKGGEAQNLCTSARMGGVSFVDVVQLEHSREMFWSSPFLGSPRKLSLGYGFWNPTGWFVDGKNIKSVIVFLMVIILVHYGLLMLHDGLFMVSSLLWFTADSKIYPLCCALGNGKSLNWMEVSRRTYGKIIEANAGFSNAKPYLIAVGYMVDTCWYLVEKISYSKIHNHSLLDNLCFPAKMWT